jgi:hypothetical protein
LFCPPAAFVPRVVSPPSDDGRYGHLSSVIAETTAMRMEMLGPQFTFVASSAKIHDQLIYKWLNGRALLTKLLSDKYVSDRVLPMISARFTYDGGHSFA